MACNLLITKMNNVTSLLPQGRDDDSKTYILGIDPGTTTIGFCAMEIDPLTCERKSFEAFTVNAEKPCGGRQFNMDLTESHSAIFARLKEISNRFDSILRHYKPVQVATELPFFNAFHPNAYSPLVQVLAMLENTVYEWNPHKPLYRIENTTAKALIYPTSKEERKKIQAIKGSKDRIIACIKQHADFGWIPINELDEHSIDACLIAECQRRRLAESDFDIRY